jgi:hypothetical protein
MRVLSIAEWLSAWEAGQTQRPAVWTLTLLTAAYPNLSADALAQLTIGQRDKLLLGLRQAFLGAQIASLTECPACREELELTFGVADVCATASLTAADSFNVCQGDWQIRFRLPTSLDLFAIDQVQDLNAARRALYERCVIGIERNGEAAAIDRLPEFLADVIVDQMAELDPQGDVRATLSCPACTHQWPATFDIVRFMWSELNAWAIRILGEVHTLASHYGWHEADILAMSPWRRQVYLDLIG